VARKALLIVLSSPHLQYTEVSGTFKAAVCLYEWGMAILALLRSYVYRLAFRFRWNLIVSRNTEVTEKGQ
jgi:hypothetical protein